MAYGFGMGGPAVYPPQDYGYPMWGLTNPGEVLPETGLTGTGTYPGGGTTTQTNTSFSGWTPPNGGAYQPWGAPGYGTYNKPEQAGFNLFQDARAWLSRNPQIFNPYQGEMVAQNTGLQTAARQGLWDFMGSDPQSATRQGMNVAASVGGYQPQSVTSSMTPGMTADYGGDVYGGSFTSGDWGAYMNPYTQNVVDTTLSDIDRSRQIANQQGARSASASTYGGDRNALIEAETNRGYADVAARTLAQLRSNSFDSAATLMGQDLGRGFQAQVANQGMRQGSSQFNASQLNNMGQFNAGLGLQAQVANQNAGLQGGALRLGAATALGGLGNQYFNQNLQGYSALNQLGTQDQTTQQNQRNAQYDEYMRSVYGPLEGYNFLGGLLSGSSYATPGGPGRGRSALGGALSGASIGAQMGGAFGLPGWAVGAGLGGLGGLLFG